MILCVRVSVCVSAVNQHGVVDQRRVVEALHVELDAILVYVAGQRQGAGGGGGMSVGVGVHVEEGGEPGVYTHLSARYGVHC